MIPPFPKDSADGAPGRKELMRFHREMRNRETTGSWEWTSIPAVIPANSTVDTLLTSDDGAQISTIKAGMVIKIGPPTDWGLVSGSYDETGLMVDAWSNADGTMVVRIANVTTTDKYPRGAGSLP